MEEIGQLANQMAQPQKHNRPSPSGSRPTLTPPDLNDTQVYPWVDAGIADGSLCPVCTMTPGSGWVRAGDYPIGHPQFGQLVPCPACSGGNLPSYLRRCSRLAGELLGAHFANYIDTPQRRDQAQAARDLIKAGHGWLTIWGGNGQGKSYLLACIVNAALGLRRPAVYTTAADLLDHLRTAFNPQGPGLSDAFDYWRTASVLAVDEVSEYYMTPWAEEKMRQLLGYRYDRRDTLITAFACEMKPGGDDWPASLGWLYSRMSHGEIVEAHGGDVRPLLRGK